VYGRIHCSQHVESLCGRLQSMGLVRTRRERYTVQNRCCELIKLIKLIEPSGEEQESVILAVNVTSSPFNLVGF